MNIYNEKPKIVFYRQRSFGELINVTFDFIRENWKPLLRFITYLVLPVALLQGVSLGSFLDDYMGTIADAANGSEDNPLAMFGVSYLFTVLFMFVGYFIVTTVTYVLMQLYDESPQRLKGITFDDLKPRFWHVMGRVMITFLIAVAIGVAAILLMVAVSVVATPLLLFILVPAGAVLAVPYSMVTPLYVFEDCSISEALQRGYRLGFKSFWLIIGLSILLSIIVQFISGIVSLPMSIFMGVKMFLGVQGDGAANGPVMTILSFLLSSVSAYVTYLVTPIMTIGLAYLYSHTVEKEDGLTNSRDIANFEQMTMPRHTDIDNFDQLV